MDDGYELTIVPSNSLLYRGIRYYPSSGRWGVKHGNNYLYFANFKEALLYSFLYDKRNPACAKIVEYQTTRDLRLINFNNPRNFQLLFERGLFDEESLRYFQAAFSWRPGSETIKRFSDFDLDTGVAEFVVEKLPQYDGYIYFGDDFHTEMMISRPIDSGIILTGREWRHIPKYDLTSIYETSLGELTGRKIELEMYNRQIDTCRYTPDPNDLSDKLYFLSPLNQS